MGKIRNESRDLYAKACRENGGTEPTNLELFGFDAGWESAEAFSYKVYKYETVISMATTYIRECIDQSKVPTQDMLDKIFQLLKTEEPDT